MSLLLMFSLQLAASYCFIKEVIPSLYNFNSGLLEVFLQNGLYSIYACILGLEVKIASAKVISWLV